MERMSVVSRDHKEQNSRSPWSIDRPLSRRSLLQGAVTGALAAGMTSLAPPAWATGSKRISFVGWEGYDTAAHVGNFLDAHNASIDATYVNTTEDMITKLRSGGLGAVDIVTFPQMYNPLMGEVGLLTPLKTDRLTNFSKMLPRFQKLATAESAGICYGAPFTFSSCALIYNPKAMAAPPTSWKDFLKPEFKGRVALYCDMLTNIIVWGVVATGVKDPTRMTKPQLDQTIEMLITLKKNHIRAMPASLGDGADLLIHGEVDMIMGWEPMVLWCKAKGVEVKIARPVEGTSGFIDSVNIAKDAPNLDLDYAFVDQSISVETQAKFGNEYMLGIVNQDAIALLKPEVKALYNFDDLDAYFAHARFYPRMFPTDSDGTHVTYDDVLAGYERFLKS